MNSSSAMQAHACGSGETGGFGLRIPESRVPQTPETVVTTGMAKACRKRAIAGTTANRYGMAR
jgi:hypothetical protein